MTGKPETYVATTLDALEKIVSRLPKDHSIFMGDDVLQDATLMRLQEAGEYLSQIRDKHPSYYEKYSTESWHKLIGLRNIIAHGYLLVDMAKIWQITQSEIPNLITELNKIR